LAFILFIVLILCSVTFIVCVVLCPVFRLIVVLFCMMCYLFVVSNRGTTLIFPRVTEENLSQVSRYPGRDSNRTVVKYEPELLPLDQPVW
jgi:hypothetical protein